ncbi:13798_t:CDS:2 [Racocetra persica]|uniref:13798_t:CDS:1 n=1 Tax=Racocetra persica TaxID=160502 RepID=A0ACA9KTL4_9GLOM|nr:13798_t:CDS:2 [Racocetra persica]
MIDVNPEVWTTALEGYINTVIEGNKETFKNKAQTKVSDEEELFRSYCEKIFIDFFHLVDINSSMSRKIVEFDWIESYTHATKIRKSSTNSGIVKVDIKETRVSDGLDIFHMEVADGNLPIAVLFTGLLSMCELFTRKEDLNKLDLENTRLMARIWELEQIQINEAKLIAKIKHLRNKNTDNVKKSQIFVCRLK